MVLTHEQLKRIMPHAADARLAECLTPLNEALAEFEITTVAQVAAFLAQIAHESGEFKYFEEIWGPTAAQKRYEPPSDLAKELGNISVGDGKLYKGRGPIQITGRNNYSIAGRALGLGVTLLAKPELAATPELGFRIAGWFWRSRQLNHWANRNDEESFKTITKRINGGLNGWESRLKYWERAKEVLKGEVSS